ncbi:hypothetical protein [Nocardia macrotermitis]|uniref:hypothetical protein n=1 Tax=Nocardia macrotermitis TaxID=2585198 RepID=UPI00129581F1|nr:hypothetical protein [Nocardia macrotermitis]
MNDAVSMAVVAHLARELNAHVPPPFSIDSTGSSLVLLEADGRKARLVASVPLDDVVADLEVGCDRLEDGLADFRDDVAMALRARWPLDEGAGGTPICALETGVLRIRFQGPSSELRLADLNLDPGEPRTAG